MASSEVDLMEAPVKHVTTVEHDRAQFRGGVFLPDGELLVADKSKSRLLLFADDFFYLQEFQLPEEPADITVGSNQKIYVTTYKNKLLKCEIDGDDLNILETYDIAKGTNTIDTFNDELVMTCSGEFKILDLDGKEVQSLKRGGSDTPVVVSDKLKRVYHKDGNKVIGRKLSDGNEVFNFKVSECTTGDVHCIALDRQDNVYAGTFPSKKVVQISKNRRKHRVLIEKFDKMDNPFRMLFHPSKDLFIVFGQIKYFEVYQF